MVVSTFQKRGLLRTFKAQATEQQKSLYSALLGILSAPVVTVQKGRIMLSTASGELSTSYSTSVGLDQAHLMEVVSELLDRYDQAGADLIAESVATKPNDDQIYGRMMQDLRAIKGYTTNFMYIAK